MTEPSVPPKVPYILAWSSEEIAPLGIIHRPEGGIGYAGELRRDRDEHGVLWNRMTSSPGVGRPLFKKVHPQRQRRVMRRLLCQVCAGPASRTKQGHLWLMPDFRDDWPGWPKGIAMDDPPLCLPCARHSVQVCPALRRSVVAVRARSTLAGVTGKQYLPTLPVPISLNKKVNATFGSLDIRWTLAASLIRTLHNCTFVNLNDETDHAEKRLVRA